MYDGDDGGQSRDFQEEKLSMFHKGRRRVTESEKWRELNGDWGERERELESVCVQRKLNSFSMTDNKLWFLI